MNKQREYVAKSNYVFDVFRLVLGSGLGQLIIIATIPVLSRLYSPSEFGEYAVVLSICAIVTSISCFRYETAIVTCDSVNESYQIYVLCVFLVVFMSIICALSLVITTQYLGAPFETWFIPVVVLFQGLALASQNLLVRNARYNLLSVHTTVRAGLVVLMQVSLCSFSSKNGLLLGHLIGVAVISVLQLLTVNIQYPIASKWRFSRSLVVSKKYSEFPKYNSFGTLINAASLQLPVTIIAAAYGNFNAGIYAMASSLVKAPVQLLSSSVKQVHLQLLSSPGNIRNIQTVHSYTLITTLMLPMILIVFIDPGILGFVLGNEWVKTYDIIVVIVAFYIIWLPASITTNIFSVTKEQKKLLFIQIVKFLFRVPPLVIMSYMIGFYWALCFFVILSGVVILLQIYIANKLIQLDYRMLTNKIRYPLLLMCVLFIGLSLGKVLFSSSVLTVLVLISISIYYCLTVPRVLNLGSDEIT